MKIITVETKYYLLKKHEVQTGTKYEYYYVKTENQLLPENAAWMQGYVNHYGGVSLVGAPITNEELIAELEAELQEELNNVPSKLNCFYYECAQGKHFCHNDSRANTRCNGVCEDYKPK